MLVGLLIDIFY